MQEKCENEKINRVWRKQELPVIGQEQTQNGASQTGSGNRSSSCLQGLPGLLIRPDCLVLPRLALPAFPGLTQCQLIAVLRVLSLSFIRAG